jgi:hypothetical protein
MTSAWGNSWGNSWGNAWGSIGSGSTPFPPTVIGTIAAQTSVVGIPITPLSIAGDFANAVFFILDSGALPTGIALLGSGTFVGTPTQPGVYSGIVVRGANPFGSVTAAAFTWTIQALPLDVFPMYLPGATLDVVRSPTWKTGYQEALAAKVTVIGYQQYPVWEWEFRYELLDDRLPVSELRQIVGLFNSMRGRFGTFRFLDPHFNTVVAEPFGTGNGTTLAFQLIANYAVAGGPGTPDIIQNLANTPNLYDNGTLINPANYSIGVTGIVTFTSAPVTAHALTWSGSFYYRGKFLSDRMDPAQFLHRLWELKSLKWRGHIL